MKTTIGVSIATIQRLNERLADYYDINADAMRAWLCFFFGGVILLSGLALGNSVGAFAVFCVGSLILLGILL